MHTPTPWNIHKGLTPVSGDSIFSEESGYEVARIPRFDATIMGDEYEGNAAFIVQACNAHDALTARVAELEGALEQCITDDGAVGMRDAGKLARKRFASINDAARAALAKARQC